MNGTEARLDDVAETLARHLGQEEGFQVVMTERLQRLEAKLDAHIQAQDEMTRALTKSALGLVFTVIGSAVMWGLTLLKSVLFPAKGG